MRFLLKQIVTGHMPEDKKKFCLDNKGRGTQEIDDKKRGKRTIVVSNFISTNPQNKKKTNTCTFGG